MGTAIASSQLTTRQAKMMKYLLLALAVTAISAQFDVDEFLEEEMGLPCTPKPCVPVCKPVTKYMVFGAFKIPYTENECKPDSKCLAAAAACIKKLQAAMLDASKKATALEAASKKKNGAHATKKQKDAAAAAKKAEAAASKTALAAAKAAFEVAEKEAASAKAASVAAAKNWASKSKTMDARRVAYEKARTAHLAATSAYDGAKSAAAKAHAAYVASVKAHCDAEALHASAVKNIGHGHLAQKNCKKFEFTLFKSGHECLPKHGSNGSAEKYLGRGSLAHCQALCKAKKGCNFIIYGIGRKAGACYWEYDKACTSGKFEVDQYNIYQKVL